jgi:subtilisin family serine protease
VDILEEDFSGSGSGDRQGHGTHCAGTIFGRDVGGRRIGIARGVRRALIGKVLGDDGSGTSDMIFSGIQWAIQRGAHVISMSLGFDFPGLVKGLQAQGWPAELATSTALEGYRGNLRMFDALMQMAQARAAFGDSPVIIAAAGNESRRQVDSRFEIAASLPAAAEGVISVGALQRGGGGKLGVTSFSNTFPQISAPGLGILSAWPGGGLRELSGTSMACPHVAGVASLWWEELRKAGTVIPSANSVAARLLATARANVFEADLDPADRGAGLVTAPA